MNWKIENTIILDWINISKIQIFVWDLSWFIASKCRFALQANGKIAFCIYRIGMGKHIIPKVYLLLHSHCTWISYDWNKVKYIFWVGRVRRRGPHSGAERVFTVFWQVPTPFCSRISDWLNPSSETFHPWSSKCWNIVFGKKKLYSLALNYMQLMIFWIFMVFLTKNLSYVMRKEFLKYLL